MEASLEKKLYFINCDENLEDFTKSFTTNIYNEIEIHLRKMKVQEKRNKLVSRISLERVDHIPYSNEASKPPLSYLSPISSIGSFSSPHGRIRHDRTDQNWSHINRSCSPEKSKSNLYIPMITETIFWQVNFCQSTKILDSKLFQFGGNNK